MLKPNTPSPTYGASSHYLGREGEEYFDWQQEHGHLNGQLQARWFSRFVHPTNTVIEFGCGGGYLVHALDCARRIGVEINPVAREHSLRLGLECFPDLRDVPERIADVAISNHALEHVPSPIDALRQLGSKLKPDGVLLLCVPIDDWRRHSRFDPNERNHHLYTWTVQLLGNMLCEAGFEVHDTDITMITFAWPPNYHMLHKRLPPPLFDALCKLWAVARLQRQLFAVAKLANEVSTR